MARANGFTINGRFLAQRVTGVQRYAHEIVAELDRLLVMRPPGEAPATRLMVPAGTKPDLALRAIAVAETRLGGGPLDPICLAVCQARRVAEPRQRRTRVGVKADHLHP
jgi:hypothetical protein